MNSDLLNYSTLLIFYFVLCLFLYDDKLEGLVLIIFFFTNFLGGYKLILDVYKENKSLNLVNVDNFLVDFMLSSQSLLIVTILLIVIIILFFAGSKDIKYVSLDYIIILSMIWITMMLMSTFFLGGSKLPYYPLYGLGVLMILISNIVMLFGFNRLNLETLTGNIPLSKTNRKRLNYYKTLMIMAIVAIGLSFYLFIINSSAAATPEMFLMFIFILYCICYAMIFLAYNILNLSRDKLVTDNGKNM